MGVQVIARSVFMELIRSWEEDWKKDEKLLEEIKRLDKSSSPKGSWGVKVIECRKILPGVYLTKTAETSLPSAEFLLVHESVAHKVLSEAYFEHFKDVELDEEGFIAFDLIESVCIASVDFYRKHLLCEADLIEMAWDYRAMQEDIVEYYPGLLEKMNEEYDKAST